METEDIKGVEIFATGTWNGDKFTVADLDEIERAHNETRGTIKAYLKLGHDKGQKLIQKDGFPAAGWIENVRRVGDKLKADFMRVPRKIAKIVNAGGYRKVSAEIWSNLKVGEKVYPKLLSAVALLGADMPAVQTLDDIVSLYASADEVLTYAEPGDARAYEFEIQTKKKEDAPMPKTVEELTQELTAKDKELSGALARIKEFEKKEATDIETLKASVAEFTTKNGDQAKEIAKLKSEKAAAETKLAEFTKKANDEKVTADVEKLIKEKHLLPAQKDFAVQMLTDAIASEKTFSVDGKDVSEYDRLLAFMAKTKVDVKTKEESQAGERQGDEGDPEMQDKKAKEFMAKAKSEGREVSYKEALLAISPENKPQA